MQQEVLARIEAGAGSGPELPDLCDRILDLFKVVSRDGQPGIWLMGQRPPTSADLVTATRDRLRDERG